MVAYDENSLKALGSKYGNNYQVTLNQRHLSTKFKEYIETWFGPKCTWVKRVNTCWRTAIYLVMFQRRFDSLYVTVFTILIFTKNTRYVFRKNPSILFKFEYFILFYSFHYFNLVVWTDVCVFETASV